MNMSKFLSLCESILSGIDLKTIRPQSIVVIDSESLKEEVIRDSIVKRKGLSFYNQLLVLAKEKKPLYVSALKTVRPVNNAYASLPTSNDFQEADLVDYAPGLSGIWKAPLTLPIAVLKTITDPEDIMQVPVPGRDGVNELSMGDNSLNNGTQHPNVVGQAEERAKKKK